MVVWVRGNRGRAVTETGPGVRTEGGWVSSREPVQNLAWAPKGQRRGNEVRDIEVPGIAARAGVLMDAAEQIFVNAIEDLMRLRGTRPVVRAAAEQSLIGFLAHAEGPGQNAEERQEQGQVAALDMDPLH